MMIALDLEASLIENAISGSPRPGLHTFIEFCIENFDRIALLTTVEESDARDVLYSLADSGAIPEEFTAVEYIHWQGQYKDLRCASDVPPDEILFVDDDENWIHPDQTNQWIAIKPWHGDAEDTELPRIQQALRERLGHTPPHAPSG